MDKEYSALRNEILQGLKFIKEFHALLYTVVVAIFAFAFSQSEPLIFLLPVFVIIPVYLMDMKEISGILRKGAYILVFYEETEAGWETRLRDYDGLYSDEKTEINPYIFLSFCGPAICLFKLNYLNFNAYTISRGIAAVAALITCLVVIKTKQVDYKTEKEKYIERWQKLKK